MTTFEQTFEELPLAGVHDLAAARHAEGWRYVQILAVNTEEGIDLVYSYMKDGHLANFNVSGVKQTDVVPSITDLYLEAFVCENEIHDLFDVAISDIAIDFGGMFYQLAEKAPMTVPSITDLYLEAFVCENEIHDLFDVAISDIAIDFGGMFYQLAEKAPMTVVSPEQPRPVRRGHQRHRHRLRRHVLPAGGEGPHDRGEPRAAGGAREGEEDRRCQGRQGGEGGRAHRGTGRSYRGGDPGEDRWARPGEGRESEGGHGGQGQEGRGCRPGAGRSYGRGDRGQDSGPGSGEGREGARRYGSQGPKGRRREGRIA